MALSRLEGESFVDLSTPDSPFRIWAKNQLRGYPASPPNYNLLSWFLPFRNPFRTLKINFSASGSDGTSGPKSQNTVNPSFQRSLLPAFLAKIVSGASVTNFAVQPCTVPVQSLKHRLARKSQDPQTRISPPCSRPHKPLDSSKPPLFPIHSQTQPEIKQIKIPFRETTQNRKIQLANNVSPSPTVKSYSHRRSPRIQGEVPGNQTHHSFQQTPPSPNLIHPLGK